MKLMAENAISSFFYYMWNAWGETECKIVFGGMHKHFWGKWNALADKAIFGAAERFYAELSDNNREMLVNRAVVLYDGKAIREEPHDDDTDCKWCAECNENQNFCTLSEYKQRMENWWRNLDFITMESITGLHEADYSSEDGSQSFVDACNDWWNALDYDTQRVYIEHTNLDIYNND